MDETKADCSDFVEAVTTYGNWLGLEVRISFPDGRNLCWVSFTRDGTDAEGGFRLDAIKLFGSGKHGTNTREQDVHKFAHAFVEDACRAIWMEVKERCLP